MITLCYIHVPGDAQHNLLEDRFIESYQKHPPGVHHRTIIICQGAVPHRNTMDRYQRAFPDCTLISRGGAGKDIGGFIDAAKFVTTEFMLCFGGSTTVRKAGWMMRMQEACRKHGPGFYGSLSSFQVRPHFNTNGFWLPPELLLSYPRTVDNQAERYNFEHGEGCLWWQINKGGLPTKLVTWCGEYDWKEWRKPDNISCRGDQSNCLCWFRINDQFEHYRLHDAAAHNNLMYLTDAHVLDPYFREQLKGLTPLGAVVEG